MNWKQALWIGFLVILGSLISAYFLGFEAIRNAIIAILLAGLLIGVLIAILLVYDELGES